MATGAELSRRFRLTMTWSAAFRLPLNAPSCVGRLIGLANLAISHPHSSSPPLQNYAPEDVRLYKLSFRKFIFTIEKAFSAFQIKRDQAEF